MQDRMNRIVICRDAPHLYATAADFLIDLGNAALTSTGSCAVALPGGNTPRRLFELLARQPYRSALLWERLHYFWGDERCVPKDHPESNFRLAHEAFLRDLSVPEDHLHRVVVEDKSPFQAAADYELELQEFFQLQTGVYPEFDLVLLGMGADGHTASLFQGGPELKVRGQLVTWSQPPFSVIPRITLTLETINRSRHVAFLVTGASKASALRSVLNGETRFPAALVQPGENRVTFFVDKEAASEFSACEDNSIDR